MDADWSVELGSDDPVLEFPWSSGDSSLAYIDLKLNPECISNITEAAAYPELAKFLLDVNGARSPLFSAKCDVWTDRDLIEAEAIYNAKVKFCSYIDLLFADNVARFSFPRHEQFVKSAALALNDPVSLSGDESYASAEFIVRRCWYRAENDTSQGHNVGDNRSQPQQGLYVTLYLFGYGDNEAEARSRWSRGLERANAVLASFSG